mgnify:CR=1 FL=1
MMNTLRALYHRIAPHNATQAWLWLVAITVACLVLAVTERGFLPWVGWAVAALIWLKAHWVAVHYLEIADAGPVFGRVVTVFMALVPIALVVMAWLERGHG